jgi:hypothetical protein
LNDIGRNCLLGHRKKMAKFLMGTFTCRSTFLYDENYGLDVPVMNWAFKPNNSEGHYKKVPMFEIFLIWLNISFPISSWFFSYLLIGTKIRHLKGISGGI